MGQVNPNNNKPIKEGRCFTCGGKYNAAFVTKPCPECNRQYNKFNEKERTPEVIEYVTAKAKDILIPPEYVNRYWSSDMMNRDHKEELKLTSYQGLVNLMNNVHSMFSVGKKVKKSVFLATPPGYSKVTWAYSCMQLALSHGYTVAPILDTREVQRLFGASVDNPRYRLPNGMTYEDYIMCDVVIITVSKTYYRKYAHENIMELFDIRARHGLATIVLSRFTTEELAYNDYRGDFLDSVRDFRDIRNDLKAPVTFEYARSKVK